MTHETNPYEAPRGATPPVARRKSSFGRVWRYSYFTSVAVGISLSVGWFLIMYLSSPLSSDSKSTDFLHPMLQFLPTLPSVLTSLGFSFCYCWLVQTPEDRKMWPAVVFGLLSGIAFNAMTAIFVIEHFFKW